MATITKPKPRNTVMDQLGDLGDSLWDGELLANSVPFSPKEEDTQPKWSLVRYCFEWIGENLPTDTGSQLLIVAVLCIGAIVVFGPLDILQFVFRPFLLPIVLAVWSAERAISRLLGYWYACPLCFNPMRDPLVYCPECRKVQPLLRPTLDALFWRKCLNPKCAKPGRWFKLGRYLIHTPKPLACRGIPGFRGCNRPHRLEDLAGKCRCTSTLLISANTQAKHCLMGHLFSQIVRGVGNNGSYLPAWQLSSHEYKIASQLMVQAFSKSTTRLEYPGKKHTFARTFLVKHQRRNELAAIHNIPVHATRSDQHMGFNLSWRLFNRLIFVMDFATIEAGRPGVRPSQAETFARIVRRVEQDYDLPPGKQLPLEIAVVVVYPPQSRLAGKYGGHNGLSAETVRELVRASDPALHSLIRTMIPESNLRFLGGLLTDQPAVTFNPWLDNLAGWVVTSKWSKNGSV